MQKVSLQNTIENERLGKVLDWWNSNYMYEVYKAEDEELYLKDMQTGKTEKTNVDKLVNLYIKEIENKAQHDRALIMGSFGDDLKILKSYI